MSQFNNFPHVSKYRLAVWPAPLAHQAVITGTPARGDRLINVTFDLVGSKEAVYPGYVLETNSDAGTTRPTVRVRIRSFDSGAGTIGVAENAINWQAGNTVRVYKDMPPWSIKPRIIVSGGKPVFFKDYDIAYTNQNQIVKPITNIGSHFAGPVNTLKYYTAANSYDLMGDTLATYDWHFEGGTPATSSVQVPGYVSYPNAGTYVTRCTVTNSGGASSTAYRFVNILPDTELDLGVDSIDGDNSAGWTLKGWSRTNLSGTLRAGALVVLYGEERYGGVLYADDGVKFVGYITKRSVKWNRRFSRWDFEAASVSIYADNLDVYDTSLQWRVTSNSWTWWKHKYLTADKGIAHHLRWHTNILDIADFYKTTDTLYSKFIDVGRGGPFSSIRQLLQYSRPGVICCNIKGDIKIDIDPNTMDLADRPSTSWLTIGPDEYREEPFAVDADPNSTSHVGAGGYVFIEPNTNTPYLSAAPMEAADDYGRPQDYQGLILNPSTAQAGLNKTAGHLYARDNNEYMDTNWPLVGNFRPFIDLVPLNKVLVNVPDDPIPWTNEVFYVKRITHKLDAKTGMLLTDLNMARHTVGIPGVTITIPVPTPQEPPPPPPPPPPIIPPITPTGIGGGVWYVSSFGGGPTTEHLVWAGDLSLSSQPTFKELAKPSNWSGEVPNADRFDSTIYLPNDGSRLLIAGTRTGDGKHCIWECTNWLSIKGNPSPPTASWTERVVFGVTSAGGVLDIVNTLTVGQADFDRSNICYFTCKRSGTTLGLGKIALDGSVTFVAADVSFGIGPEVFDNISLTAGTSYVRDYSNTILFSFGGTVFGTASTCSPYRNLIGGPAVTAAHRDVSPPKISIRNSAGWHDVQNTSVGDVCVFGGNDRGTVVYLSAYNNQTPLVSTDGGGTWNSFATWAYGYLKPSSRDADEGCLWSSKEVVTSGNVPIRFYDRLGNVVIDQTGNWWTGVFSTQSTTTIYHARAWYS